MITIAKGIPIIGNKIVSKENSFLLSNLNRVKNIKNRTGEKSNKPNSVEKIIIAKDLNVKIIKSKLKYESKFVYSKNPIGELSL